MSNFIEMTTLQTRVSRLRLGFVKWFLLVVFGTFTMFINKATAQSQLGIQLLYYPQVQQALGMNNRQLLLLNRASQEIGQEVESQLAQWRQRVGNLCSNPSYYERCMSNQQTLARTTKEKLERQAIRAILTPTQQAQLEQIQRQLERQY